MNTIFPPHTLGFACIPTLPAAGCGPVTTAGNQGGSPQLLSLPGCVPTHTVATVCTQIGCPVGHTGWLGCPSGQTIGHTGWHTCPPVTGGPQNTAATLCTQIGCPPHISLPGCVHTGVCPPANGGQAQAAQAAQPQTLSVPPHCPTVAPMCPPPANGGGQAQAQTVFTIPPFCLPGGQAQAQTLPHTYLIGCPNTATCSPTTQADGGGQAQAQTVFPTMPPICMLPTVGFPCTIVVCQQAQGGQSGQAAGGAQGGAQAQTLPHTYLIGCPNTATCSPTTQADGGGQAQAQTVFPTMPPICMLPTLGFPCTLIGCQQAQGGAAGGSQGGAQAQTIFPTTLTPYCTQAANPTGAQAQTIWHTQPGYCSLSTPPLCPTVAVCPPANAGQGGAPIVSAATHCPTVPPMCPPTSFNCPPANGGQGGAQAQTLISAYTHCPTVPPMCPPTTPPTCPQPLLSVPPHCPTVAPVCPPANGGGQAQAQTILPVSLAICGPVITKIAGCGTGIPVIC